MSGAVRELKEKIISKSKSLGYNLEKILHALDLGEKLHSSQLRKSGEPYFIHPLSVALMIAELDLGEEAIIAAILHDTIEDCGVDFSFIEKEFGNKIASLVEGVTKVASITDSSLKRYAELETLRKFIIASSKDIRVLLIKLADRLHNMRTVSALKPEKQIIYAEETLKVYVPLAEYIGIGKWKRELEDISFKIHNPEIFSQIENLIKKDAGIHNALLEDIIKHLKKHLVKNGIHFTKIYGRIKSDLSLYGKIQRKLKDKSLKLEDYDISNIKDLLGISVILKNSDSIECYKALGIVHGNFNFIEKDFADYIAKPKPNGYRSIHTIVKFKERFCEIQIKTEQMHDVNEFGPASHIAYKISGKKNANSSNSFSWVKVLNLWKEEEHNFELNLFENSIFAITPKGRVVELEKSSTPIDFAYAIHTSVGNRYIGAKVNDNLVNADYQIQNGDIVEILTSKTDKKPSAEWLKYVKQNSTKNKIKKYSTFFEEDLLLEKGKKIISSYLNEKIKLDWLALDTNIILKVLENSNVKNIDDFYIKIARDILSKKKVLQILIQNLNIKKEVSDSSEVEKPKEDLIQKINIKTLKSKISFEGLDGLDFKVAGCCNPQSGEEIVGIVTLRDGLKIHRKNCKELLEIDPQRLLEAKWS